MKGNWNQIELLQKMQQFKWKKIKLLEYKIKYESIQAFGYKSLVNQYYDYISGKK